MFIKHGNRRSLWPSIIHHLTIRFLAFMRLIMIETVALADGPSMSLCATAKRADLNDSDVRSILGRTEYITL